MPSMRAAFVLALGFLAACSRDPTGGSIDGPKIFAQVCAACHGEHGKPPAAMVARLGVKDLTAPEPLYQLGEAEFPPLKSLNQSNLPVQPTPLSDGRGSSARCSASCDERTAAC